MSENSYEPIDAIGLLRSWQRHKAYVSNQIERVCDALRERARLHDLSKLADDEFAGFARINVTARTKKFGSKEYDESMDKERSVIDLHFKNNSHHPEFHNQTFLDVIEMVCDWKGAGQGYDDPRPWLDSFELNIEKKGKHLTPEQIWLAREVAAFIAYGDHVFPAEQSNKANEREGGE